MKATAKEWDEVRKAFASSIMVDTSLSSLAQNLDGPDWPIAGKEETPTKYIDLSFEETVEMLQLKGQPPELIDQLIAILRETMAFDSPFGEMVEQTSVASSRDNPLLRNLAKLNIPENFPLALAALEPSTLEFCKLEKLSTLSEFAIFAQSMSCAKAAEVASQMLRPVRSAAIQSAFGTRTPLVVPFQVKTISLAGSMPPRSAISP